MQSSLSCWVDMCVYPSLYPHYGHTNTYRTIRNWNLHILENIWYLSLWAQVIALNVIFYILPIRVKFVISLFFWFIQKIYWTAKDTKVLKHGKRWGICTSVESSKVLCITRVKEKCFRKTRDCFQRARVNGWPIRKGDWD